MYLHLDPVGGIAGDMFAAALFDTFPELVAEFESDLAASDLSRLATVELIPHRDHALAGSRFVVTAGRDSHAHRSFAEIRSYLSGAVFDRAVRDRAIAIFELLAQAEGSVHGVELESVTFHEVGAWDSVIDIVTAAWLIETLDPGAWSCSELPLGSGRVESAHGLLPVPAPATAVLLEGFPLVQDDVPGERITPTGAAILRHISPNFQSSGLHLTLRRTGIGFGSRRLDGVANMLRILMFDDSSTPTRGDRVVVCEFELDDQAPEDLAVAIDILRTRPGVIDILQAPVFGKKGRMGMHVRILAVPAAREELLDACFAETSTLGVRWQVVDRAVLPRETRTEEVNGLRVRTKHTSRPGGGATTKAEMDDLAAVEGGRAARERTRRAAEREDPPRG